MTSATGSEMAMAATFIMKLGHYHHEKSDTHNEHEPGGFLKHGKPVYSKPFGRASVPQAKADAHGPTKQKDNIPWNRFKIFHIQDSGNKEKDGGDQDDGGFVDRLKGRYKRLKGHDQNGAENDDRSQNFFPGDAAEFSIQLFRLFSQTRNDFFLGFQKYHKETPQKKYHQPPDGEHIVA